ncbi:MAG: hypothetical protein ACOX02_03775 [Acholeplasmatales bacterium]
MGNDTKNKIDLNTIELPSNEPKYHEEYKAYATILKKKIDDINIKNIGIVAPYGAGKSSLLKTYVEMQTKEDKNFKNRVISVSLANYGSIIKKLANKEDKQDDFNDEQNVEKSILQQLFYKNDNKNTPYSRFKTLKNKTKQNIGITILLLLLFMSISFLSFQFFDNIFKINFALLCHKIVIGVNILVLLVSLGGLLFIVIKNKFVKSVQVGNLNFEKNESDSISVFNKYLDEIIYFFQKNDFNILIIEDLDRFNNLGIFSKLKELNTLLNKNDAIIKKHGKITFVYAVKDSMFECEEDRSKFFEFILPVMPSLTSKNVKDELEDMLKKKFKKMPLSSQLVIDVSDYITSRRILNNVVSDFIIHLLILNIDMIDKDKTDKLFSLMVLKNILPLEYENLQNQNEKSLIFKFLNIVKKEIIDKLVSVYKEKIKQYEEEIKKQDKEHLDSKEDLKNIFYGLVCRKYFEYSHIKYELDTFIGTNKINMSARNYYNSSTFTVSVKDIETSNNYEDGFFSKRENVILQKMNFDKNNIIKEINKLKRKINELNNLTFKELFNDYNQEFDDLNFEKEYIRLVLVNGYVDETYMDYLSEQSDFFMTSNDKELIKKINYREKTGFLDKIDEPDKVVLALDENKFGYKYVMNYFIIKELINKKKKYSKQFENFTMMIKNEEDSIKEALEELVNSDLDYDSILIVLSKHTTYTWDLIYKSNLISDDKKDEMFFLLINSEEINIENLSNLNHNENIIKKINSVKNFCQKFNSQTITIEKLHEEFNLYLNDVGEIVKNKNSDFVIKNNLYELNLNNIVNILKYYYSEEEKDINSRNYDVVSNLAEGSFKERITEDLSSYLQIIYNNLDNGDLSIEKLTEILINKEIDINLKTKIIEKEINNIDYNVSLDNEILELLLKKKRIKMSLNNIIDVYKTVDEELIKNYIEENHKDMQITEELLKNNTEFKSFFFNSVDISLFIEKIGSGYDNISAIVNSKNIELLLNNELVTYCKDDFRIFLNKEVHLEKYCELFGDNILNECLNGTMIPKSDEIVTMYFATKKSKGELFNWILKRITETELQEIFKKENINDFINSVEDIDCLTNDVRKYIINETNDKEIIEKNLISLHKNGYKDWLSIFREKNNFIKNSVYRYEYHNEEFYYLLRSNVHCNRRKGVATIRFS